MGNNFGSDKIKQFSGEWEDLNDHIYGICLIIQYQCKNEIIYIGYHLNHASSRVWRFLNAISLTFLSH